MKTSTPLSILITGWLFTSCLMATVYAGDEDMNPTAYQRFDPETGFMVPIQPHEAQQQNHDQTTQGTAELPQTPDSAIQPPEAEEPTGSASFWLYLLAGITILAGFAAWIRSKKVKTSPSHLD